MSDPRWPTSGAKELLTHRQPGESPGEDFKILQTETNRRRESELSSVAQAPQTPVFPDDTLPAPDVTEADLGPDRLHKWGSVYVAVSKNHNPGEDPVINPGYKTEGIAFSSVVDAYRFAGEYLLPLIADDERIVVIVFGGTYSEPFNFGYSRVDLHGFGRPRMTGAINLFPVCRTAYVKGFHFKQRSGGSFIVHENEPDADGGARIAPVFFEQCMFEGGEASGDVFLHRRRVRCVDCDFMSITDAYPAEARFYPSFGGYSDFIDCRFYGKYTSGRPSGSSFGQSAQSLTGYYSNTQTALTGARFFNCQHYGTLVNAAWNMLVDGGRIVAGRKLPTGLFSYAVIAACYTSLIAPGVNSFTEIDGVRITGSLVFVSTDASPGGGAATNTLFMRDSMNLFPPAFLSNADAVTQLAAPSVGACTAYIVESATHCTNWGTLPVVINATASTANIANTDMSDFMTS